MSHHAQVTGVLVLVCGFVLGGCVDPGRLDPAVIGRYQRAMERSGPEQRAREELGPMEPVTVTDPSLKTVVNEETGKVRIFLSLDEAVMRALANNTDVRIVSYDPSISREQMVQAAGQFDYIVFGGFSYEVTDEQTVSAFLSGEASQRTWNFGIRQKTVTGAGWELGWNLTRTFDISTFQTVQLAYDNRVSLEITQPLLRDAWPEFNLAGVRIARVNYKLSMEQFRTEVEKIVTDVITTYWVLVQARRNRVIQQELLDRTIEARDRIDKRRAVDATEVEFKQAEAAVETRRADLIRAERVVVDAQDVLTRLIGDAQMNVLSGHEVVPTTRPNTKQVRLDETDQLLAALRYSPLLEQARLAIALAEINVTVAKNQTLPRLDLQVSTEVQGVGPTANEATKNKNTGDFVSTSLLIQFEYPLGNRVRIAELRRRRLERLKGISTLQNVADQIALQVRGRIRQANTAYVEIVARGKAVVASRDELEALGVTEQLRRLSPEFVQVKLSAQERLANAERAEIQVIVDYNVALVELARATGTILELNQVEIALPSILREAPAPTTGARRKEEGKSRLYYSFGSGYSYDRPSL